MAIESMKKVLIVGMADEFSAISQRLQRLSVVHVDTAWEEEDALRRSESSEGLQQAEHQLMRLEEAIAFLRRFHRSTRGMLSPRPEITLSELESLDDPAMWEVVSRAEALSSDLAAMQAARNRLLALQQQLQAYMGMDIALRDAKSTKHVAVYLGSVADPQADEMEEKLAELGASYSNVGRDLHTRAYWIAVHKEAASATERALHEMGFMAANLPIEGVPAEENRRIEAELSELERKTEALQAEIAEVAKDADRLESLSDYYRILVQRQALLLDAAHTQKTFVLRGWVPSRHAERLEKELRELTQEIYIAFEDCSEEEEDCPVAVKNNKFNTPFEAVTDLYSTPLRSDIDPTPVMSVWFIFLFGMMMADAAYGAILSIGALLFQRYMRSTGMMGQITMVIAYGGIGTMFWGVLFGGWFGEALVDPVLFSPMNEPMLMMGLCLGIGILHISVGLLVNAYNQIRHGHLLDAVFDNVFILAILWGAPLLILGMDFGLYVVFAGLGGILLTAGRKKKGIGKVIGGFSGLYGVTNYLSDVLSYSRLFGLGLSTGVIAMVFNTIANMLMGSLLGWVFAIAVLAVGHIFNIGIGVLGAFIHACRLQYIEYYSKFFEGGGTPYTPYTFKTKHVNLKQG